MGNNLFGADIAGKLNAALGPGLLDATLSKVSAGTRTPGSLAAGTNPTEVDHACKGFLDDYTDKQRESTTVREGDRIAVLLGDSINGGSTVPSTGDKITIESVKFDVVNVKRDPDAATYTCQIR